MTELATVGEGVPEPTLTIFDESNPYSLISLIDSAKLKEAMRRVQLACQKMLLAAEPRIIDWAKPTDLVVRLRLAFWDEYERVMQYRGDAINSQMQISKIIGRHCDSNYFYEVVCRSNKFMVYLLTPPQKYELSMRQILDKATNNLLKILQLPIKDKKGKVDKFVVQSMIRIYQLADARVQGAVAQRIQIQSHTVHENLEDIRKLDKLSYEELDALNERVRQQKEDEKIIDAQVAEEANGKA